MLALVCLSVWLAVRCIFFVGFEGSDDLFYVRFARLWHRVPANQWEVRLLADALIGLSIRVFGYHEWSAALPAMAGSLAVLATTLVSCRLFCTIRQAWWAGLLVAVVPLEVTNATTVSAHTVMVGFVAVGTLAFLRADESCLARWLAVVCLPPGMVTHWGGNYYVAMLVVAALMVDWRRYFKPAACVCISALLFMAADMLVFKLLFGDALCRYRVCSPARLEPEVFTGASRAWEMLGWAAGQWICGKPFGIALLVAMVGAAVNYRKLSTPLRVLFWTTCLYWLEISFGSYVPWAYRPFWRNTRYLHPLVMPAAILFATVIAEARFRRAARALGAATLGMCACILAAGGTWGQNVHISRELLAHVLAHPQQRFVADVCTLNEIYVLNGLVTPPNLAGTTDVGRTHFLDDRVFRAAVLSPVTCDAILINPLNVDRVPSFAALVKPHLGPAEFETSAELRPIARLVPSLASRSWAIRKPAGSVHAFVLNDADAVRLTDARASRP